MAAFSPTDAQRAAIESAGRSVIVSAAAGAGKTSVLTRRVLEIVSGNRPDACDADRLLVLTFTEAAAAQMRSRIADALRERLAASPHDARLNRQLALLDVATISTVHAFCNRLIREHFAHLELDPMARVMDDNEASLLRHECMDALFTTMLEGDDEPAAAFRSLLDLYHLGDDASLAAFVLRLHAFLESLPKSERWLHDAVDAVQVTDDAPPPAAAEAWREELREELDRQVTACGQRLAIVERRWPELMDYAAPMRVYLANAQGWLADLADVAALEAVRASIAGYVYPRLPSQRGGDADAKAAVKQFNDETREAFNHRLKDAWCVMSMSELAAGLRAVAPAVATYADVARRFDAAYAAEKRRRNLLDFSDLERHALALLCEGGDPDAPSPVALQLRDDFDHVLVDEFQDINPVQAAILKLVSREDDAARPANLFVVGDVKQSIYRFRLAEPAIFTRRLAEFAGAHARGAACHLPDNFRSAPGVVSAINACFERLMTPAVGGLTYDDNARLAARRDRPAFDLPGAALELHLMPPTIAEAADNAEADDDDERAGDEDEFARYDAMDREAVLIGRRIRELMNASRAHADRPLRYGDVAVLMRSVRKRGPQIARRLARMGIPAQSSAGGLFFDQLEVRDVMAMLAVLDNPQQDIPLAAVLRSPFVEEPFSDSDLVEIRSGRRGEPFYLAAGHYAEHGPDASLRERVASTLRRLAKFRRQARETPVATFLWQMLERTDYFARVAALPGGEQRRANLHRLHDMARAFESTATPTLARFIRLLETLRDEEENVAEAPSAETGDDAVRIMSIHKAKGLEFPVVFLADAGKKFNRQDAHGRVLFDRERHIGPKVVDDRRMIEYPSLAHRLVKARIERQTLAEELRLLYVAMTRAMDKLIVVATVPPSQAADARASHAGASTGPLPDSVIASANRYADWLINALAAADPDVVAWGDDAPAGACVSVCEHAAPDVEAWITEAGRPAARAADIQPFAELAALAPREPRGRYRDAAAAVIDRLFRIEPTADMSAVPAVIAASELKRRTQAADDEGAPLIRAMPAPRLRPRFAVDFAAGAAPADLPARRGTATHLLLENLDLAIEPTAAAVATERDRLVAINPGGDFTAEDAALIDADAVAWFLGTPLGQRIRASASAYRRELMFVSREPVSRYDPHLRPHDAGDYVMIRGVIDGVLVESAGIEIVDYKTDDVSAAELDDRVSLYRTQIELYARAAGEMLRRPVTAAWLVFLAPRRVVEVPLQLAD